MAVILLRGRYDPETDSWLNVGPMMAVPRLGHFYAGWVAVPSDPVIHADSTSTSTGTSTASVLAPVVMHVTLGGRYFIRAYSRDDLQMPANVVVRALLISVAPLYDGLGVKAVLCETPWLRAFATHVLASNPATTTTTTTTTTAAAAGLTSKTAHRKKKFLNKACELLTESLSCYRPLV